MKPDEDFDVPALMALEADRVAHAYAARATGGLSPIAVALAFSDWALHLAAAPGKQADLARKSMRKWLRYANFLSHAVRGVDCPRCIEPRPLDPPTCCVFRPSGWPPTRRNPWSTGRACMQRPRRPTRR